MPRQSASIRDEDEVTAQFGAANSSPVNSAGRVACCAAWARPGRLWGRPPRRETRGCAAPTPAPPCRRPDHAVARHSSRGLHAAAVPKRWPSAEQIEPEAAPTLKAHRVTCSGEKCKSAAPRLLSDDPPADRPFSISSSHLGAKAEASNAGEQTLALCAC